MTKAQQVLRKAEQLAAGAATWADLSNALFDPYRGLLTREFPAGAARAHFRKTPEYKAIGQLLEDMMERTGVLEGATPRKSGKFVVRLPSSLHAALEREAEEEGVSLNQLVVTKLAINLKTASGIAAAASPKRKSA
jgi:predicted HicB family RNase H-like nuclease